MYKFLPILLFAFLIADESTMYLTTEGWEKSDKLKDILKELKPEMDNFNDKLSSLLHPDKFLIKNAFKIIDTTRIENSSNDSLMSKITILENRYFEGLDSEMIFSFYKLSDSGDYYEIITTWYAIEIIVDNSIELDNQIQDMVWMALETATGLEKEFDPDLLIFNSEDIKQFQSKLNKPLSLNRDDIYNDSWAVIIGIDKYDNLSNLDYAVADAEAVKDMLVSKFDYKEENIKLLLNEEANKANIVNVISDVSLKAGENDRILVFYAGHGETMPLPDGGEMGYLVPIDGRQENLYASAIPMDDLKRLSNMSKAKHMLFLVDACYGGLAAVGSRGLEPAKTPNYIEKITNIKSRQIITAGGKDEKVFEKSEWGHSAYTKNLLSALEDGLADSNGDGYITADELGDYLSEKVSIDSENQQTPQSRRLTSHEGEFIFIANDMQINVINTVERNEEHPKKFDEVLLNNERHDIGINVFGLGLFSGSDKKIINEQVKGGLLVSIFGNAKLNLVDAKLYKDKNIINIIVLFGGCTILVPPEMYVDTQILPIFGSFKNRNDYIIEDSNQTNKKLIVRGVAIFGGGSVRNEKWYDNMGNWQ